MNSAEVISFLSAHWPARGDRHRAALAAAGALARWGIPEDEATTIVISAARSAGDLEAAARARDVHDTYRKVAAGQPVMGVADLQAILGEDVIGRFRALVGARSNAPEPSRRPRPSSDRVSTIPSVKGVTALPLPSGLTLEALAAAKHLPIEVLQAAGVCNARRNGYPAVRISYPDLESQEAAVQYRVSLAGHPRFVWRRGDHPIPYGLDQLSAIRAAGWCLFVEGATDQWTARKYGLPCLALPGKTMWRPEWATYLDGVVPYLWQEPDAADLTERMARDLPDLRVILPPEGVKDLNEAHVQGQDVLMLIGRLRAEARPAQELVRECQDHRLADFRQRAASVLDAPDPVEVIRQAIRADGYGGDLRPAMVTYFSATTRVLAFRHGAMPAHLLLVGPSSSGKNYTERVVRRHLPTGAYHVIDAGSPRTLIYDHADLRHKVLVFGEADSLPAGEDNPAASAIRNLLQDHNLHYEVTIRDPETGDFVVRKIEKPGPTVLITTAIRRLGEQLDSRLFVLDMPDDQGQIREALRTQASLELAGAPTPSEALVAFQAYLQGLAPWGVVVPFVGELAEAIGHSPVASRVLRDFARLISLIKAVAVLRHPSRRQDARGRVVAEIDDYRTVYELVNDVYLASTTGAGQRVRQVVQAVAELEKARRSPIRQVGVAEHLGIAKMAVSRWIRAAIRGGWLVNKETRPGRPYALAYGDPLPPEDGLPRPETLTCNTVTAPTDGRTAHPHTEPTEVEEVLIP